MILVSQNGVHCLKLVPYQDRYNAAVLARRSSDEDVHTAGRSLSCGDCGNVGYITGSRASQRGELITEEAMSGFYLLVRHKPLDSNGLPRAWSNMELGPGDL